MARLRRGRVHMLTPLKRREHGENVLDVWRMGLKEYHRKRDFRRTPEPKGKLGDATPGRMFVVQKHAARRLHYDFRLELDGTLKSWAVPKGPSLNPATKALAVHVEDHPLEYATFEGIIPQGEYGGGTVMVWDHGTWEPDGDPARQYRAGKLSFELHGEKLRGGWTLVRMSGRAGEDGKNWLLIKRQDKAASKRRDIVAAEPASVVSGREMQEIAADADRVWSNNGRSDHAANGKKARKTTKKPATPSASNNGKGRVGRPQKPAAGATVIGNRDLAKLPGAKRASLPRKFKPQLAVLAAEVPTGDDWLHEMKFDGYRLLAFVDHGTVRLITRNGNDWTHRFGTIRKELESLPVETAILDGEIVSLNKDGLSDFQELQNLLKRGNANSLVYYVFDGPYLNGFNLQSTPLVERKQFLARLLLSGTPNNDGVLRYSDHIQGSGESVLTSACRHAMEGVVSKRADSPYEQRRSPTWLKVKCLKRQEFVIGGFTKPSGARVGFGALLLGYYEGDRLMYAGRVGTGFTNDTLRQLKAELKQRRADSPAFANPPTGAEARGVTWVRPELVGEVEFTEWTDEGLLRHPSFQGLREDKRPRQIYREEPMTMPKTKSHPGKPTKSSAGSASTKLKAGARKADAVVAGVTITHPDRVLYPEQGVTKLDLAKYYEAVADWVLPYVTNRPLTLVRCPSGRAGACFYQKHMKDTLPDGLRSVTIQEKDKADEYVVVDDLAGLVSLVQMSVLEIHPWGARADQIEKPDLIVFDLDPGPGVEWDDIVTGARLLRKRLDGAKLNSFVRTSGGKGLHVVVPLKPGGSWEDVKEFARAFAQAVAHDDPRRYIATASKAKRKGKIFVDYLRNSRGATAIASYSTRARAGAPVAMPLDWKELSKVKSGDQYTVFNAVRRLGTLRKDPWESFFKLRQSL